MGFPSELFAPIDPPTHITSSNDNNTTSVFYIFTTKLSLKSTSGMQMQQYWKQAICSAQS